VFEIVVQQGGKTYAKDELIDVSLGDVPIAQVCEQLRTRTRYIVLKLPLNFDLDGRDFPHGADTALSSVVSHPT